MHSGGHKRQHASRRRRRQLTEAHDDVLLAWTRDGNEHAFAELYRRHRPELVSHARRLSRRYLHTDAAEDLVSEAVTKTLRALQRGNGPQTSFRRYMFASLRNIAFTRSLDNRIEPTDQPPDGIVGAPDEQVDVFVATDAFSSLPSRWQQILWATKVLGYEPSELTDQLGLGANGIAVLSNRARDGLRIAYARAQLPQGRGRACTAALDAIARGTVTTLSARQTRLVINHLAECESCRDAAGQTATATADHAAAVPAHARRIDGWHPARAAS